MQNYRNHAVMYNNYQQSMPCASSRDKYENKVLAMAYVPWQKWQNIYDVEKGFCRGTIFQELDLPFFGVGGCQK